MWIVLCSATDTSALWAYQGLRQLGVAPLELVTAEALASATHWEHTLNGSAHVTIKLADGRRICSSNLRGVLNRLSGPAAEMLQRAVPGDQDYVQAEMYAFYLSWIHSLLGVVINRPTPLGLSGPWYHPSEWVYRASRAGLPTPQYRLNARDPQDDAFGTLAPAGSTTLNVITMGGTIYGGYVPGGTVRGCARLAESAGTDLLGVSLYLDNDARWTFAGAMPLPDLTVGGTQLLRALADKLTERGRA
jgi:hypothetical protein